MTAFCESEAMKCEESLWTLWLLWTLSELTTLWLFRLLYFRSFNNEM